MKTLSKFLKFIDSTSKYIGWGASMIAIPMILALVYEVFARYVFHKPTSWSYEITYMIYGSHFLLGAAFTLYAKGHIRIDLLYMKFSPRGRAIIDILGYSFVFFPVVITLVISGFGFAHDAFKIHEVSQFTPWQPLLWPFKSIIAIGFFFLLLQGLAEYIRAFVMLLKGQEI